MLPVLVIIISYGIAVLLMLAVHEFGHALGGRLRGLRLSMLIVGPLYLQRGADDRLHWRLNRKLAYAGGVVSCAPHSAEGLRRAMLSFAAGGPVASLAMGVFVLAIYVLLDLPDVTRTTHGLALSALSGGVLVMGGSSLGMGLMTLLPVHQGALVNDGKRVLILRHPSAIADRHAAIIALSACLIAGARPRDLDPGIVTQALSVEDGSYDAVQGRHMAYLTALDRGDVQAAGEHIRYMVDHIAVAPAAYGSVIDVEAAYFEAAYGIDAAAARGRLAGAGKSVLLDLDPSARPRAKGAVLLAEDDKEGAYAKFRMAYARLASGQEWGSEFWMDEIRRLCRARGLPDPAGESTGPVRPRNGRHR